MAQEQKDNSVANKRIARNSIYMSIRMLIVLCLTLYITSTLLNVLGVEDYGVYNVVCGVVSMLSFLNTSMSNAIQRFFNFELGEKKGGNAIAVFNMAILIQLILVGFVLIFAETIGLWYLQNKMVIPDSRIHVAEWIYQFSVISFAFAILQSPFSAAIMAHERMDYYAAVNIIDVVLKLIIVCTIPYIKGDKLLIYGLLFASINVLNFFLYSIYAKVNFIEIQFSLVFRKSVFFSMLSFSGWNFFGSFAGVAKEQGINLVLNLFCGPIVNAARGVVAQINAGIQSFVQNISVPVRPQVIQSYASKDYERCINLTYTLSKLSCCLIYLISLPILIEIDFLLSFWLGDRVPEHTNNFLLIIILVAYVNNLNAPISNVIHASGKMKTYQIVTSFISLMCIPCSYLLLLLGATAEYALFTVFFFSLISQFFALKIVQRVISFSLIDYFRRVLCPFFSLIIFTFIVPLIPHFYMDKSINRFILVGFLSTVAILIGFYLIVLNTNERRMALQVVKNIKNRILN